MSGNWFLLLLLLYFGVLLLHYLKIKMKVVGGGKEREGEGIKQFLRIFLQLFSHFSQIIYAKDLVTKRFCPYLQ